MVVRDVVRLRLTSSQTESEDVPEFRRTPPVPVEHLSYLAVVKGFSLGGLGGCASWNTSIIYHVAFYPKYLY